ncbi:Midasin [Wickerhamomyces ciferrii]|uniref:Midasin n=1 Tax=Wickerhamomyces ciferrii (strain ATCC 14091 / BCRC 22168 / CBS 111 / JCM 3599 / NBRC 0793 / NRRL Y-1031 F-60-10) TaxID=1206466 RepID=K0KJU1_WICCF|nr:Midasin [Wickerhamomyces ciferrii]CCH42417.1 Midasin [Wickerhamomyces ciferrii]
MSLSDETISQEPTAESQDDLRPLDFEVLDSEDEEDGEDPFKTLQRKKRAATEPVQQSIEESSVEQSGKRPKTAPNLNKKPKDLMSILLPDNYEGSMMISDFSILQESTQLTSMVSAGNGRSGSRDKPHDIDSNDIKTVLESDETVDEVSQDQGDEPLEAISHNEFLESVKESSKKKSIGELLDESDNESVKNEDRDGNKETKNYDISYEDVEIEDEGEEIEEVNGEESDESDDDYKEKEEENEQDKRQGEDIQDEMKPKSIPISEPITDHQDKDHNNDTTSDHDLNTKTNDTLQQNQIINGSPNLSPSPKKTNTEQQQQPTNFKTIQDPQPQPQPQQRPLKRKSTLAELCSRNSPVPRRVGLSKRANVNHLHSYLSKK